MENSENVFSIQTRIGGIHQLIYRIQGKMVASSLLYHADKGFGANLYSQRQHAAIYAHWEVHPPTSEELLDALDTLVCWVTATQGFSVSDVFVAISEWNMLATATRNTGGSWKQAIVECDDGGCFGTEGDYGISENEIGYTAGRVHGNRIMRITRPSTER